MSTIEWTDATWNPVTGCADASPGCRNCYAKRMTARLATMPAGRAKYLGLTVKNESGPHWTGAVRCHESELPIPLKWKRPRMIFVNSMSDTFHSSVPFDFVDRIFAVMALCPQHTFQVLTKRPERMAEYLSPDRHGVGNNYGAWVDAAHELLKRDATDDGLGATVRDNLDHGLKLQGHVYGHALGNVWLGTSCENQEWADERIPHLLRCPAAVRFLSCEPLLGWINVPGFPRRPTTAEQRRKIDIDIRRTLEFAGNSDAAIEQAMTQIDWVIIGGESGPGARPCDIDWIRSIRDQCRAAGVACFIKQLGSRPVGPVSNFQFPVSGKGNDLAAWPDDLRVREYPACTKE